MRARSPSPYHAIASLSPSPGALPTEHFFEVHQGAANLSPLDEFISNANRLHVLAAPSQTFSKDLGALLLLGYMSAVESFVRRLIVATIQVDEYAQARSASRQLIFGATLCNAKDDDYADALLENYSLAGKSGIVETLKEFVGLGGIANELESQLRDYQEICELRHCCVHRFGRLGAKNAVALGLAKHKDRLGHEFRPDLTGFEDLASRLRGFSKGLNNTVWERIMRRTAENKNDKGEGPIYEEDWKWKWRSDRKRFTAYWQIFATTLDSIPSPSPFEMYETFRSHHEAASARRSS